MRRLPIGPAHRGTARDLRAQVQQVDRARVASGCTFAHRFIIALPAPGMVAASPALLTALATR